MPKIDESRPFLPVNIAVLTVSDTRTFADDKSGNTLVEMIERDGHKVVARKIVRDEKSDIAAQLRAWIADPDNEQLKAHYRELQAAYQRAFLELKRLGAEPPGGREATHQAYS